jgi:RNA polymerase sigma factor (sigma-70 family)
MDNKNITVADKIADEEIITRVLNGEKNLYALLVRRYNQRLYRVGMGIINDDDEVEDVMQVAYIKAYENLSGFEHKSSFSTWLTRILINECLLRIRKRKSLSNMSDDIFENKIYQLGQVQTPLMKTLNSELKNMLEDAISKLPEKYRIVFIMREIEDMSVAETQECLDLSEANVKVRLNRAKAMLRNAMSDYYKKEDLLHLHLARCSKITEHVMKQIEKE